MRPDSGEYAWYFGARFRGQHGVFSYFRMANVSPYDGRPITDTLIRERVTKYFARYTALLFLQHAMTEDRRYVNYFEMYGFSDLDSMGSAWPPYSPPCRGDGAIVCIIPDGDFASEDLADDLERAAATVARMSAPLVQGRAPSWIATISVAGASAERPFQTES